MSGKSKRRKVLKQHYREKSRRKISLPTGTIWHCVRRRIERITFTRPWFLRTIIYTYQKHHYTICFSGILFYNAVVFCFFNLFFLSLVQNVLRVRHMVVQRRPSRQCSILIWGGFLLLYAALTAIIDCTQSNGTSTTIVPLSSTDKQFSSPAATPANTEVVTLPDDGLTTLPSQSSPLTGNVTTESSSVIIVIILISFCGKPIDSYTHKISQRMVYNTIWFIHIALDFKLVVEKIKRTILFYF